MYVGPLTGGLGLVLLLIRHHQDRFCPDVVETGGFGKGVICRTGRTGISLFHRIEGR